MRVLIHILAILPTLLTWLTASAAPPAFTCDTFRYQEQAQAILAEDPADPFGLDHDGNGLACESLPNADRSVDPPLPGGAQGFDLDCLDFAFQDQAQRVYNADPGDPHGLDPTHDGIACSRLPERPAGDSGAAVHQPPAADDRDEDYPQPGDLVLHIGIAEAHPADPFDGGPDRDVPTGDRQPTRSDVRGGRIDVPTPIEPGNGLVEAARVAGDPGSAPEALGKRQQPRAPSR